MSPPAPWEEVLDRFEASLAGYGDGLVALDTGSPRPPIGAFETPAELGPMPPSLVPRARRLVLRATRLEAQIRMDLEAVGDELRARAEAGRRPTTGTVEPRMLDRIA